VRTGPLPRCALAPKARSAAVWGEVWAVGTLGIGMTSPAQVDSWKLQAAERALAAVEDGMLVGLGSGTTAARFVDLLGERVRQGLSVTCVPTSESTRAQAERLGVALTTLDDVPFLDLTVDGADELDSHLRLIKGGGGALLREKIVAVASQRMLVIADATKHVGTLGNFPLPVEVVRFGLAATRNLLGAVAADAGCSGEIRLRRGRDGEPFVTDGGNVLFDCVFGRIDNPEALDLALKSVPGVVENGLFLGIADAAIIAGADGVSMIERGGDVCEP
jgi:ribose 5-phosphate isomerase A